MLAFQDGDCKGYLAKCRHNVIWRLKVNVEVA